MALVATSTSSPFSQTYMAPDPRSRAIDATSTDPWGPSRALLEELRLYTLSRHAPDVLHVLHDALLARGPDWRRALKALTTIAYCLREGSNEVALFASAHAPLIRQLVCFEHVDVYRLDRGAAVREEARAVARMLQLSVAEPPAEVGSSSRAHSHVQVQVPSPYMPGMSWDPWLPRVQDTDGPSCDSDRLASLLARAESAPDDQDTWLDIYKLLFLLQNALPSAPNDVLRHWMHHTHLFRRIHALSAGVAVEVRRLAGELLDVLQGAGVGDVRRRAKMF